MSKKRSKFRFIWLTIAAVVGIFLSIGSFPIPYTSNTYNGFAGAIELGLDLTGGVSNVYECTLATDNIYSTEAKAISETASRLKTMLSDEGYNASVVLDGDNSIRIDTVDDDSSLFSYLDDAQPLYMTLVEAEDGAETPTAYIVGTDVESVQIAYDSTDEAYGINVTFTSSGKSKFASLTKTASNGSGTIYIYLGEVSEDGYFGTYSPDGEDSSGTVFITGDDVSSSTVSAYAYQILCGSLSVNLTLVSSSVIAPTLGTNALTLILIALIVAFLLAVVFMVVRYGDFGLLAGFSMVFYLILLVFFLQAVPFVELSLSSIAGIILGLVFVFDGHIIIFEKIREEYASGKKIPLATKTGFKRALWPILDSSFVTLLVTIVLYAFGSASLQGFAIALFISVALSMLTCLVTTRLLVNSYVPLNSTNAKKLRLYRDKNVKEYKEPTSEQAQEEISIEAGSEPNAPEIVVGGDNNG